VPPELAEQVEVSSKKSVAETVKEYLSDPRYRIKLDDLFAVELRRVVAELSTDAFPANPSQFSPGAMKAEFPKRLKRYEEIVRQLQGMSALLGKWAGPEHRIILEQVFARMAEANMAHDGLTVWLGLRWYPVTLLMYAGGVAALSAERYDSLASILTAKVAVGPLGNDIQEVIRPAVEGMLEVTRSDLFKTLPGHERQYTPSSEYMFKAAQPVLEDALFLGRSYETLFDRFEVFMALVYADVKERSGKSPSRLCGPIGRYGWKYSSGRGTPGEPFSQLVRDASRDKESWAPLRAGLFEGSFARFDDVATRFALELGGLGWL
jgi:hypothetical protein